MVTFPINDDTPFANYTAAASQTIFAYPFWLEDKADLKVYVDGILKTHLTDYTIDVTQVTLGGNVTFLTPMTGGEIVVVFRETVRDRATGFTESGNGDFSGAAVNLEYSRLVVMAQEDKRNFQRCLRLSDFSTISTANLVVPDFNTSGGKVVAIKAAGTGFEYIQLTDVTSIAMPAPGGNALKLSRIDSTGTGYELATLAAVLSLTGNANKLPTVNSAAAGFDFLDLSSGGKQFLGVNSGGTGVELHAVGTKLTFGGPRPYWASTTTIIVPAGFWCRDDADGSFMLFSANQTFDITTATGAAVVNALMDGDSRATDTTYMLWAISKANGADARVLVTDDLTTIATMPTDYTLKRPLLVFRTDATGSGEIRPFVWGLDDWLHYNEPGILEIDNATPGPLNVLDDGNSTTKANVSCANFAPNAIADMVEIRADVKTTSATGTIEWYHGGSTTTVNKTRVAAGSVDPAVEKTLKLLLDSSSQFAYKSDGATIFGYADVMGYRRRSDV